ncbi:hypothetical protein NLI96_g2114 [Meripilus lineatus]|uniref:Uncharacterized protein n=1 Tax=Meripilus lineatus TaxID=2056292 RepID=A0AAD5YGV3_9APHY|nr:hypothetical protein NLI96_g2114 [Physisporinus lineatus]
MSRNSALIWSTARRHIVGLPPCPSFLSEPAYANLVFRRDCHHCEKGHSRVIIWEYRARYCRKCINEVTTYEYIVEEQFRTPNSMPAFRQLLCVVKAHPSHWSGDRRAHKPDLDKVTNTWRRTAVADREQLCRAQEKLCQEIQEFSSAGRTWIETEQARTAAHRAQLRMLRYDHFVKRLTGLWLEHEIDFLDTKERRAFKSICFTNLPSVWDEGDWLRAEEKAIAFFDEVNARRRRRVEEIITTSRRIVKPDTFRCLSEMMPDYLENWREEKLSYLEGIIRDSIDLPEDVQAVDLAIGHFFECGLCQSILDIQRVPQHDCMGLGNKKDRYFGRTDYEAAAIKATRSLLDIPVTSGADILRELLEQCGQDYRRATPQDMDELGLLLCCRVCSPSGFFCRPARREVMNWRVAAYHALNRNALYGYHCVWDVMQGDDPRYTIAKAIYGAALEQDRKMSSREHQIENPVEHRDFFFYFDQESLPTRTYFFHTSPMLRRKSEYVEVMDLIKRGLAAVIDLSNMIEH